jgi:hypothetical protein
MRSWELPPTTHKRKPKGQANLRRKTEAGGNLLPQLFFVITFFGQVGRTAKGR